MKDLMKNSYILTSDIRMAENVYHQHEYHSWYALKYFEGDTEEWPVEVNSDLKITGVKSEGQDTLCIYGPTYLNSEFSQLLFEKIKDIYEDESKKDYYWKMYLLIL